MAPLAEADQFLALAEVGIGIVGFGSLVLAVTRGDDPMTPGQSYQFREMILAGFVAVALSVAPVLLSFTEMSRDTLWRSVSGAHALVVFGGAIPSAIVLLSRMKPADRDLRTYAVLYALILPVMALQVMNALAWPFAPGPFPQYLAICMAISVAGIYLGRLLFTRIT